MWRSRRLYLGLGVSAVFLVLLLRQVDGDELAEALREARPGWIALAAVPFALGLWLRALRWRIVLRPSLEISTGDALAIMIVGFGANNVLPARAGEVVRAGMLQQRYGASWTLGLGTIVVERVLDGLVLSAFLVLTIALAGGTALLNALALLAAAGFAAAAVLLVALTVWPGPSATLATRLLRFAPARLRPRLRAWSGGFVAGMTALRGSGAWAAALAATAASWAAEGAAYWLVGRAFGLDLAALLYSAVVGAANLALAAPSTAAGIGPYEFFTREVAVAYGAAAATATAYAIALHALTVVPLIVAALVVLWRRNLGLRTLAGPAAGAGPTAEAEVAATTGTASQSDRSSANGS